MGRATYGYISSGPDRWKINKEEAKRVRMTFDMIAQGKNYQDVLSALNVLERKHNTGVVWLQKRVRHMLRNVVYIGDFYSHGTVCMTPGHQVINRGYRDRYKRDPPETFWGISSSDMLPTFFICNCITCSPKHRCHRCHRCGSKDPNGFPKFHYKFIN